MRPMSPPAPAGTPAVLVEGFSLRLGGKTIVDDLSFDVRRGEVFAFLGSNGSGKTSTIRTLLGIYAPTAGRLLVDGRRYDSSMTAGLGYLPEERGLYGRSRVLETMIYFGELKGLAASDARSRARAFLERVGLADKAMVLLRKLSGGEQQKVQLGVTVLNDPELLILDEPTKGLDPVNRELLMELLLERKQRGTTIIYITHQMDEVERLADRVMIIKSGRRQLLGRLADVKREHGDGHLEVEFEGALPAEHPSFEVMSSTATSAKLKPRDGSTDQDVLLALTSAGLRIRRYELPEPSLNDIFIRIYTRGGPDGA
jgi:ABC-2 type transport system ATP-binding protein